jgi:hypothetical protein
MKKDRHMTMPPRAARMLSVLSPEYVATSPSRGAATVSGGWAEGVSMACSSLDNRQSF